MTLGEQVKAKLEADSAVVALVGTRIYPVKAPQGVPTPRIVYLVVDDVPESTLAGATATTLNGARVQVDSYGATYLAAQAVADAVEAVLGDLSNPDGLSSWKLTRRDLYDDTPPETYRVTADFEVQH